MTILLLLLYVAAFAVTCIAALILRRSKTAPVPGGALLVLSGVISAAFSVITFFACFFGDTGILPVPIVLFLSFVLARILFGWANRTGKTDRRALHKITIGANTKAAKRFLLSSGSVALALVIVILLNLVCTNLGSPDLI